MASEKAVFALKCHYQLPGARFLQRRWHPQVNRDVNLLAHVSNPATYS
jgi:hypothetical protein